MADRALAWRQILLPASLPPSIARSTLLGLATLPGQPRLVLEAVGRKGAISWRIGCEPGALPKVVRALRIGLPDIMLTSVDSAFDNVDNLTLASQVRISRTRQLPLGIRDSDQVTRALLGVFASTTTDEMLRLQLLLGPRTNPRRAPVIDGIARTVVEGKHGQHGFGCALRLAARSGREARALQLIGSAAAALSGLEVPGVAVSLRRIGRRHLVDVRSPYLWPLWLSVEDLVPLLAWPTSTDPAVDLPGVPPHHPRLMPATKVHPHNGRPLGLAAASIRVGTRRTVAQPVSDALHHTHVLGLTGTGKSTLLAHLALADAQDGRGAVVIDPKGDLVDDLLARLPEDRRDDIVVLDARDPAPVGINPLRGVDPNLAADSLLAVFRSLYAESWGPRTSDILHGCLLTLARRGDSSLVMVPLLLTNPGFRRSITGREVKADPLGLGSFWATFNGWSDAERDHAVQPLLNKLRQVLLRPSLRGVFGQRAPKFDISDVFTKRRILLVALGKGTIGPDAAQLLGSLVTTHLWHAITRRITTPPSDRQPVMVYIDEVQDYLRLPSDLGDALAQARGLGVGFTLSHQELGQLGKLRAAVMANARSRIIFQTAPHDARDMAVAFGDGTLTRDDFRALGAHQAYAQLLSAGTTLPWVSLLSSPLPEAHRQPEALRNRSRRRYGQPLDAVEADLLSLVQPPIERARSRAGEPIGRRRTRHNGAENTPGGTA